MQSLLAANAVDSQLSTDAAAAAVIAYSLIRIAHAFDPSRANSSPLRSAPPCTKCRIVTRQTERLAGNVRGRGVRAHESAASASPRAEKFPPRNTFSPNLVHAMPFTECAARSRVSMPTKERIARRDHSAAFHRPIIVIIICFPILFIYVHCTMLFPAQLSIISMHFYFLIIPFASVALPPRSSLRIVPPFRSLLAARRPARTQ